MTGPEAIRDELPFWKRQFAAEGSGQQLLFDVVAGILLPILCLVFDPLVFRPGIGESLAGPYAIAGRLTIGLSLASLAAWLVMRRPSYFLAGALAAGAVFSTLLGIALLPFSVFGLMVIIGALGFAPFLTGFVFWRNSERVFAQARAQGGRAGRGLGALAGVAMILALPLGAQILVGREVARVTETAMGSDSLATSAAVARLERIRWMVDTDAWVRAYERETNPERRLRLERLYRTVTGRSIEERRAKLAD